LQYSEYSAIDQYKSLCGNLCKIIKDDGDILGPCVYLGIGKEIPTGKNLTIGPYKSAFLFRWCHIVVYNGEIFFLDASYCTPIFIDIHENRGCNE